MSEHPNGSLGDLPDPRTMSPGQIGQVADSLLAEMGWVKRDTSPRAEEAAVTAGPGMALFALVLALCSLFFWPLGATSMVFAAGDLVRPDTPRRKYWVINLATLVISWWVLIMWAVSSVKAGQYSYIQ